LSEVSETPKPPVGATPFRVTVPVEDLPPNTVLGFNVIEMTFRL
jgi:hypothetical protein